MSLLSTCVDWGRARAAPGGAALSAAAVCSQLSPDNPATPCVSLQPFLAPSDGRYWPPQDAPLAPCRAQPCNGSHVCLVNRNCAPGRPCLPYSCVPGCRLGEVSQYVVPVGTWVRLAQGAGARDCPKACQCGATGALENCQPLACVYFDPCMLSDHQKIAHKAWFYLGCNVCTCFAGEVTCSKRQCDEGGAGGVGGALMDSSDAAIAALPCRCPPHYVPVCGRNGNTYPSSCLARCAGLTDVDFEFGPCSMRDPCAQATCAPGQRCVPARKTCLSLQYRSCPQHECVDVTSSCSTQAHEPVCDTEGVEHPNLCYLLKDNKVLAYRGPCLEGCSRTGVVCGADGNSYASECAAWAARAPVDYAGPCAAVGFVSEAALAQCGAAGVHCPALPLDERGGLACDGLTPPGACCPVCAGALRLLYSHKQVDRILYSLKGAALEALTVHSVLAALERQVQIADCSVRGYLTVELDLIALVMPAGRGGRPASALQREACAREAEKLASLVQRSSPRMLSELSLSVLSTANVAHSQLAMFSGIAMSMMKDCRDEDGFKIKDEMFRRMISMDPALIDEGIESEDNRVAWEWVSCLYRQSGMIDDNGAINLEDMLDAYVSMLWEDEEKADKGGKILAESAKDASEKGQSKAEKMFLFYKFLVEKELPVPDVMIKMKTKMEASNDCLKKHPIGIDDFCDLVEWKPMTTDQGGYLACMAVKANSDENEICSCAVEKGFELIQEEKRRKEYQDAYDKCKADESDYQEKYNKEDDFDKFRDHIIYVFGCLVKNVEDVSLDDFYSM